MTDKNLLESPADFEKQDSSILYHLHSLIRPKTPTLSLVTLNLVDKDLIQEVKSIVATGDTAIYFGKTLRDIKCVIKEDNSERYHELFIYYKGLKNLSIVSVSLLYSPLQEKDYTTLGEIILSFKDYVNSLSYYFYELERLDSFCTVMEPLNPSLKDDYRRILLNDRTWLHVEVTKAGLATNIHLIGQSDIWHDKLQAGLLTWDHDKDIVANIMLVFDLTEFPVPRNSLTDIAVDDSSREAPSCGICLCDQLPDNPALPLPLCQNPTCGVYFHRNCLYQMAMTTLPDYGERRGRPAAKKKCLKSRSIYSSANQPRGHRMPPAPPQLS